MTEHINSAAAKQTPTPLDRDSFAQELRSLNRQFPNTGFGIALRTHSGEDFLLANSRMPLPSGGSEGFPTGRRVARLEHGDRFRTIEILADAGALDRMTPGTEADILGNALELIARIDRFAGTAPVQMAPAGHTEIAATGTGG